MSKKQRVIDLVRKLDEINRAREKLAADVRAIENEIEALVESPATKDAPPENTARATSVSTFSKAGKVLDHIRKGTLPDIRTLAIELYQADNAANRNKARAVIYFLEKKQKMIRKRGEGWEIAMPDS